MRCTRSILSLLAAAGSCLGGSAVSLAQTAEIRIVEVTGQTSAMPGGDTEFDFAVQARIVGGPAGWSISGIGFDVVMPGEPDTAGTLRLGRISNADHTYYSGPPAANQVVGLGGLAVQFDYLANLNAAFNGSINTSVATFTNTPGNQEIGLVFGTCRGDWLIRIPGIDLVNGDVSGAIPPAGACNGDNPRADCIPDTWNAAHPWNSSTGTAPAPVNLETTTIDPAIGGVYLGQGGQWIDFFRFRYTLSDLSNRAITLTLANLGVTASNQMVYSSNGWFIQANTMSASQIRLQPLTVTVGDVGACCHGAGCAVTTQTACTQSSGVYVAGQFCTSGGATNFTTCCVANFNGVNGLEVLDIFDFINAWFAGNSRTDVDHDGSLGVGDVLAFVGLWFAGCG